MTNVGLQDDEAGSVGDGHRPADRRLKGIEVLADVAWFLDVPTVGAETGRSVVGEGEIGRPVDGDPIVVVDHDESPQAQVACEARCLVTDALHEVTV